MPAETTACPCGSGPWIYASMCKGTVAFDRAGRLASVACPSMYCTVMVDLDSESRIPPHDGRIPGQCPFIGVRVFLDPGVDVEAIMSKGGGR